METGRASNAAARKIGPSRARQASLFDIFGRWILASREALQPVGARRQALLHRRLHFFFSKAGRCAEKTFFWCWHASPREPNKTRAKAHALVETLNYRR